MARRFPGQWVEAETGLLQNWHRDYDPSLGRYIEADPLGLDAGQSLYGYVGQDPLGWIDPEGLYKLSDRQKRKLRKCRKTLNSNRYRNGVKWFPGGSARAALSDETAFLGRGRVGLALQLPGNVIEGVARRRMDEALVAEMAAVDQLLSCTDPEKPLPEGVDPIVDALSD